jgi:hypothetical protein
MRNPGVGCRQDQVWMQRGMDAPLQPQQTLKKGDEHPPLIPPSDPQSSPSLGDQTTQSMFRR